MKRRSPNVSYIELRHIDGVLFKPQSTETMWIGLGYRLFGLERTRDQSYREVFERVEEQTQGQLGFVQQALGLRDAGQSATENSVERRGGRRGKWGGRRRRRGGRRGRRGGRRGRRGGRRGRRGGRRGRRGGRRGRRRGEIIKLFGLLSFQISAIIYTLIGLLQAFPNHLTHCN